MVYTALNAVFYTANNIAYSALTALITKNNNERVQLGSFRFMFAVITNIVMGFSVTGLVEKFGGGTAGWRTTALIFAIIGLVVNTISCLAVRSCRRRSRTTRPQRQAPTPRLPRRKSVALPRLQSSSSTTSIT